LLKEKLKYFTTELAILLILLLASSCSDDSIKPQPEVNFDQPRFNWRIIEIPGNGFAGIWARDTNNIYLANNYDKTFYHVSNGNINIYNVGNYGINEIEGVSGNEIYLFGAVPSPDNTLTLIKWNGASFEYYPTGINVTYGYTIRGCIVSSNEIWIASEGGISKFDGVNIINYSYENPLLYLKDLFLSSDNKVQYISERRFSESTVQQSLYEFRNSGFVRVYDETFNPSPSYPSLSEVGGIKYGLKLNTSARTVCMDNFTDTSFIEFFCFNNKITITAPAQSNNPVGINLQDLVSVVEVSNTEIFVPGYRSGIIHWNGNKPSAEIGLNVSGSDYNRILISIINSNTYLVLEPPNPNNRILHIGTKK
jgi:hypothetical protein